MSRATIRGRLHLNRIIHSHCTPQYYHSFRSRTTVSTPPPFRSPRRSAIDPTTFLLAAAVSLGVAFVAAKYTSQPTITGSLPAHSKQSSAPGALPSTLAMAAQVPPGRPGNLTAEQEAKLKEMWIAVFDIFGVQHRPVPVNENAAPSTDSPDKKKKKTRLSMFGKKHENSSESDDINDKHGSSKVYQTALASQSPEALNDACWGMVKLDHPDALMLRFLRARKWDVSAAVVMLVSTLHWRTQEMHVDEEIMSRGEEYFLKLSQSSNKEEKKLGEDFMTQLRTGKSFLHGTDKEGRPCCYVRARLHKQGEQSEKSLEQFTVYTIETARMLLRSPVDTATIVFDMTDFTLANMDYTPVKFMIKCFEANYPESLGSVLVYKAPWLFSGIWKIIKGWLDPVVASKVHFASNVNELSNYISESHIIKELGGPAAWTFEYVEPQAGENAAMVGGKAKQETLESERKQLIAQFQDVTAKWATGADSAVAAERSALAKQISQNYWALDPHVRAKSLYDRTGVIRADGTIEFHPDKVAAPVQNGHT